MRRSTVVHHESIALKAAAPAKQSDPQSTQGSNVDGAISPQYDPLRPLIETIIERDQTGLEQLRLACLSRIYTVAKRILGATQDAEEVAYDVLLWIWNNPQRHDPSRGSVLAWINNLTWSRSIDLLRKRNRRDALMHPSDELDAYRLKRREPDDLLNDLDQQSRVKLALQQLSEGQRTMILLAFFEGLSHAEIADRLGKPLGSVKSLIRRGLMHMHAELEPKDYSNA